MSPTECIGRFMTMLIKIQCVYLGGKSNAINRALDAENTIASRMKTLVVLAVVAFALADAGTLTILILSPIPVVSVT